jgi:hypothetical protein
VRRGVPSSWYRDGTTDDRLGPLTVLARVRDGSETEPQSTGNMEYSVGTRVLVRLYSGDIVGAEIVVIFTASSGKNILVAIANKFMRIDSQQITEIVS